VVLCNPGHPMILWQLSPISQLGHTCYFLQILNAPSRHPSTIFCLRLTLSFTPKHALLHIGLRVPTQFCSSTRVPKPNAKIFINNTAPFPTKRYDYTRCRSWKKMQKKNHQQQHTCRGVAVLWLSFPLLYFSVPDFLPFWFRDVVSGYGGDGLGLDPGIVEVISNLDHSVIPRCWFGYLDFRSIHFFFQYTKHVVNTVICHNLQALSQLRESTQKLPLRKVLNSSI